MKKLFLGSVTSLKEATAWLAYTYLFVRMLNKPTVYHLTPEEVANDPYLEQRQIVSVHSASMLLDKSNLIKYDKKSGTILLPLASVLRYAGYSLQFSVRPKSTSK